MPSAPTRSHIKHTPTHNAGPSQSPSHPGLACREIEDCRIKICDASFPYGYEVRRFCQCHCCCINTIWCMLLLGPAMLV